MKAKEFIPEFLNYTAPGVSALSGAAGSYWVFMKIGMSSPLTEVLAVIIFFVTLAKSIGYVEGPNNV